MTISFLRPSSLAAASKCRRPRWLSSVLAAGVLLLLVLPQSSTPTLHAQCGSNPVVCENQLAGSPPSQWDLPNAPTAGDSTIQGFATDVSVNVGGTISFKVNTPASSYKIDIYRLGYYQGNGARLITTISSLTGKTQPACLTNSSTLLYDCGNWSVSASWTVPSTAVSGLYIAKLTRNDTGGASHMVFVVRNDASKSDLLLQANDTTWQAYNQYGGWSLYLGNPQRAYKVSYNRPYATRGQSGGYGPSDWIFEHEYPMIRFLEANGYDVSYSSDTDSDRNGSLILNHKVFVSVGHDEYWSAQQRANVEVARAAGVNLAFFSGNEIMRKVRREASIDGTNTPNRTLVCYKESLANQVIDPNDPPTWTGDWRDPRFSPPADGGRPENNLTGQISTVQVGSSAITVPSTYSALRFWRNTSVANLGAGQTATLGTQTLGYEWDEDQDNGFRPAGIVQMSSTTVAAQQYFVDYATNVAAATRTHHLTLYRHSSGALVFGAGTVQWVFGLDPNHDTGPDTGSSTANTAMQQATVNLFADMGAQPVTLIAGLVAATKTTDKTPPTSTISSPANGASLPASAAFTITGTASDSGGVVGGVEVSTDGGTTWHPASGTKTWTYTWYPPNVGAAAIMSRAVDDSGNLEQPTTSRSVNVVSANCPCSLWPAAPTPWAVDENDAEAIEIGLKFQPLVNGFVNGVRFYKAPANTGTHVGNLWSSTGQLLATVTFTGESASGWQQALFTTPVAVTQGTTYVVSYHTNTGHYSTDAYYFGRSGVTQWPLVAPQSSAVGGNSVYVYGASAFPTQSYQSENNWVDLVFGLNTAPPTVSMTAPANGATVSGQNVTVSANASSGVGISSVQFLLDGAPVGNPDTVSPYSFSWNTLSTPNGTHTLSAKATDTAGTSVTSTPVTITLNNTNTTPPTVSMTAPAGGTTITGTVTLSASASDPVGIASVQFMLDGTNIGSAITTPPYNLSWNSTTTSNGSHILAALAIDTSGLYSTSSGVTVTVSNPQPPSIDVSVSTDQPSATTTVTSPVFSTKFASELLLAFVTADYSSGTNTTVTAMSGGGLTWQLVTRTNAQLGTAEIWRAFAPAVLSSVSVTATLSQGVDSSITVMSFVGVDSSGTNGSGAIGATASANSSGGAPSASLITTRAYSLVIGVGNDWDQSIARTMGSGQTMVHQYMAPVGDTYWVQRLTNGVSAKGTSATINDTAPTADRYNFSIVEVMSPPSVSYSISGTITGTAGAMVTLGGASSATATTDGAGNFTFSGLSSGTYTVTPSQNLFTFSPPNASVTITSANVTAVNFTATPVPTYSVSGNAGAATATVALTGGSTATTTADSSGNYVFNNLVNGNYTVTPSKPGFVFSPTSLPAAVNGANVGGINFTAMQVPTFSLSGGITPSASGANATVTLSGAGSATATADGSGNFSFSNLSNGTYTVTPAKSGYTFNPASQQATINNGNVTGVNFTASSTGIVIDQTVSKDQAGSTKVATAAFSTTAANELLLAFVSTDSIGGSNTTVTGVSGAGLTWTLVVRTNAQQGTSEIWRAFATSTLSSVTVTATLSQNVSSSMTVMTFKGVDPTGTGGAGAIGAVGSNSAGSGAPSASLTTTRANSLVVGVGNDWDNATARTVGANQTIVHQNLASVGDTYWVQRTTNAISGSGTAVTINDTAPTGDRFNLSICEILAAP